MHDTTTLSRWERLLLLRVLPLLLAGCLAVWLAYGAVRLIAGERVGLTARAHKVYILNPLVGSFEELTSLLEAGWRVVHVASAAASRTESLIHRCTFVCQEKTTGKTSWYSLDPNVQDAAWHEFAQKIAAGEEITLVSATTAPSLASGYHTVFILER